MKLTDLAILCSIIFSCIMIYMQVSNKKSFNELTRSEEFNMIMDEAVVDSLSRAYTQNVSGNLSVDKEKLSNNVIKLASLGVFGNETNESIGVSEARIKFMIYMDEAGFYCYKDGKWGALTPYDGSTHGNMVKQITEYIDDLISDAFTSYIPYNDGDDYVNSIYKYSFLTFYSTVYEEYCFSGAQIKLASE